MPDFVLGRRGREPAYVEYFRQEVPFRTEYPAFRLEVVTHRRTRRGQLRPLRERMIFDERDISAAQRAAGYTYYPEVLIDERPDLQHIHDGYSQRGTADGELVRLMVYLVRGEDPEREGDHWVLAIRFSTIDVEPPTSPDAGEGDPEAPEITEAEVEAARSGTIGPMRSAVLDPPDSGSGWSVIGYSAEQLAYMEWLDAYRDSIERVLMASPVSPLMDDDWQVESHFFPEIAAHEGLEVGTVDDPAHPYWGGPGAYPVRLHAAERALGVWNDDLTRGQREAAHARHRAIVRQLDRLYTYARDRMME